MNLPKSSNKKIYILTMAKHLEKLTIMSTLYYTNTLSWFLLCYSTLKQEFTDTHVARCSDTLFLDSESTTYTPITLATKYNTVLQTLFKLFTLSLHNYVNIAINLLLKIWHLAVSTIKKKTIKMCCWYFESVWRLKSMMQRKIKNTTLPEQFQNPFVKNRSKISTSIPLTHTVYTW